MYVILALPRTIRAFEIWKEWNCMKSDAVWTSMPGGAVAAAMDAQVRMRLATLLDIAPLASKARLTTGFARGHGSIVSGSVS